MLINIFRLQEKLYVSSVLVRTRSRIILHQRHSKISLFCWLHQNRFSCIEKWGF